MMIKVKNLLKNMIEMIMVSCFELKGEMMQARRKNFLTIAGKALRVQIIRLQGNGGKTAASGCTTAFGYLLTY